MKTLLHGAHKHAFDALFQHPLPHNLQWREVKSMLEAIADEFQELEGDVKVVLNDQAMVFRQPVGKDVADMEELMKIRHFLEQSNMPVPADDKKDIRLLVVIDHREARIYEDDQPGTAPRRVIPSDPHGMGLGFRNIHEESDGRRKPERKSFYREVAKALRGAGKILIFGSSTGASSAMEQLLWELKTHFRDVVRHIVGSYVVDEQHLSENQLLAMARKFHYRVPRTRHQMLHGHPC